jgi:hypothetical protein
LNKWANEWTDDSQKKAAQMAKNTWRDAQCPWP